MLERKNGQPDELGHEETPSQPAPGWVVGDQQSQVLDIGIDELEDSPFQVKRYDDARVKDLAETIRRQGLLQPATVRPVNGRYQLISGHGRRAALRYLRDRVSGNAEERARFSKIRCLVLGGVDDARAAALTAIENLQRDDGTPLEQAQMVARARDAGRYETIPDTAEALGLPLGRVRQYLQLADAPPVLQRAVSPGVTVLREDGGRERVALPVTSVLAVRPYYDFLFENRLAELKGQSAVQRRRDERRRRVDDSPEARERENQLRQTAAHEFAAERAERLLVRAARQLWTVAQLQAHVRGTTKAESMPVDDDFLSEAGLGSSRVPKAPRLFEDKGGRLTIWPPAIANAGLLDRSSLAEKLRVLLHALEA